MKYYKRVDQDGNTITVESYSHDKPVLGAVEIDHAEFQAFIDSLPPPPEPETPRDLGAELDELKAELKSKGYIS